MVFRSGEIALSAGDGRDYPAPMSEASSPPAADALVGQLYDALRDIAHRERGRAGRPQTLQTTAVVNEAYLRLRRAEGWQSREHFLASAATAMRHVLVDAARARLAAKRGDGVRAVPIDEARDALATGDDTLVRIDDALTALRAQDERLARVVECRFFGGLSEEETGKVLGISDRTVRRDWLQAKAWLFRELGGEG